jgi:phosphohistidine phosphatase
MRQLLLLRHAHAENAVPGSADFDRPLSPRGRAEALEAAHCIRAARLHCDELLVSPATRTRQTAAILAGELECAARTRYERDLYLADASMLLQIIAGADASAVTVLVVAHNPGISELAQHLAAADPPVELRTSGLCLLRFDADGSDWNALETYRADWVRLLR